MHQEHVITKVNKTTHKDERKSRKIRRIEANSKIPTGLLPKEKDFRIESATSQSIGDGYGECKPNSTVYTLPNTSKSGFGFTPQLYTFHVPPCMVENNKKSFAQAPPFYVQLDHTIAVIWILFSGKNTDSLGIAQLQWSLLFLCSIQDHSPSCHKNINICIKVVQEELLQRYATMADDLPDSSKEKVLKELENTRSKTEDLYATLKEMEKEQKYNECDMENYLPQYYRRLTDNCLKTKLPVGKDNRIILELDNMSKTKEMLNSLLGKQLNDINREFEYLHSIRSCLNGINNKTEDEEKIKMKLIKLLEGRPNMQQISSTSINKDKNDVSIAESLNQSVDDDTSKCSSKVSVKTWIHLSLTDVGVQTSHVYLIKEPKKRIKIFKDQGIQESIFRKPKLRERGTQPSVQTILPSPLLRVHQIEENKAPNIDKLKTHLMNLYNDSKEKPHGIIRANKKLKEDILSLDINKILKKAKIVNRKKISVKDSDIALEKKATPTTMIKKPKTASDEDILGPENMEHIKHQKPKNSGRILRKVAIERNKPRDMKLVKQPSLKSIKVKKPKIKNDDETKLTSGLDKYQKNMPNTKDISKRQACSNESNVKSPTDITDSKTIKLRKSDNSLTDKVKKDVKELPTKKPQKKVITEIFRRPNIDDDDELSVSMNLPFKPIGRKNSDKDKNITARQKRQNKEILTKSERSLVDLSQVNNAQKVKHIMHRCIWDQKLPYISNNF